MTAGWWGYRLGGREKTGWQRFLACVLLLLAALVVTCHGAVTFVVGAWFFPIGLIAAMMYFFDPHLTEIDRFMAWATLLWLPYAILAAGYIWSQRPKIARAFWITFAIILLITIGGCQPIMVSLLNIP